MSQDNDKWLKVRVDPEFLDSIRAVGLELGLNLSQTVRYLVTEKRRELERELQRELGTTSQARARLRRGHEQA